MFSAEYGWMPKKKIKPKVKLFGGDDFKFFIFISIFIFCLAGLVLLITGDNVDFYLKYLMREKGISLLPKPSSYLFFAGEDFEAISSFIIGLGKLNKRHLETLKAVILFRFARSSRLSPRSLRCIQ